MILTGRKNIFCKFLLLVILVIVALFTYYLYHRLSKPIPDDLADEVVVPLPPSPSKMFSFQKAAIVTNGGPCAQMAKNILNKGGNAVDAAITALLCDGVACPQSMGLGGGFLMTIYNRTTKQSVTINAREKAPSKATQDMFHGNPKASQNGPLAAAIPGELRGYWKVYKRFGGKLPWRDLFTEVVEMTEKGIPIGPHLAKNILLYEAYIRKNEELTKLFINEKNETKTVSDTYVWPSLAHTLKTISIEGGDALHDGSLTEKFVKDIQDGGGIITVEDMNNYDVIIEDPVVAKLKNGNTLFTTPLPGTGVLLGFMLRVLQHLIPAPSELLWHQRFTETMKYAYAYRGYLGDNNPNAKNPKEQEINKVIAKLQSEDLIMSTEENISDTRTWQDVKHYNGQYLQSEDHGTANIVVLSPDGDAVVTTSTVNLVFGSRFVSKSTGIILNNEMDDFSSPNITNFFGVPPSPANFIQPNKRPLSSMCPTVVTDANGDVKIAIGAAGGTKITTSLVQVIMLNLWMNNTIKESVDSARIHHQLHPMKYGYEHGVLKSIIQGMRKIGHVTMKLPNVFTSSVTVVSTVGTNVTANADFRRPGGVAGF